MRRFIYPSCLSIRNATIKEKFYRDILVCLEATKERRLANVLAGNSREKKQIHKERSLSASGSTGSIEEYAKKSRR